MTLTAKEASKIRKLLALALDARGEAGEADSAAVKALELCRLKRLSEQDLADLLDTRPKEIVREQADDPIGAAIARGMEAAVEAFAGGFVKGFR